MARKKHRHVPKRPGRKRHRHVHLPPGTLTSDPAAPDVSIHVMAYGPDDLVDRALAHPREALEYVGRRPVTWIAVRGAGNADTIRAVGEVFGLHPLALEDAANDHQRAKIDPYPDQLFIVARMIRTQDHVDTDQLGLFLGQDLVVTFQHGDSPCVDTVRQSIRDNRGHLRERGCDYLAYTLLDTVVDAYFPVLESYGERLDRCEDEILAGARDGMVSEVHALKRDLLVLRRAAWSQRDALYPLVRDGSPFISKETGVYLRDLHDHVMQMLELIETDRELGGDLMDLYLSSISNRMNQVMKMLTLIATIFLPLGFVAGVYGMNFNTESSPWNMPELNWRYGYPFALALMGAIALAMLAAFRRKRWF